MPKKKKLPRYKITINAEDETGFDFVAFVDEPAIETNWMAFKNQIKFVADSERKIVTGPLLIADMEIYRRNDTTGEEFNVVFEKPVIEQLIKKFMKKGYAHNVNEMHDANRLADGVYLFEIWQSDKSRGVLPPKGFNDLADGSAFASYSIENPEIWNNFIKTGEFKGFSIEGNFNLEEFKRQEPNEDEELGDIISFIEQL